MDDHDHRDSGDRQVELGTASAAPGEVARGWFDISDLPTGASEQLPVVIANGPADGPTLWLTGGVHGDEATGVAVVQDAMASIEDGALAGALIDCHTAGVGSEPFAIRDRVLYGERRSERDAVVLFEDLGRLVDAFGFRTLREYPTAEYVEENLQRSTAGAVLNEVGIPAFTAELGAHSVVDDQLVDAGIAGICAVSASSVSSHPMPSPNRSGTQATTSTPHRSTSP